MKNCNWQKFVICRVLTLIESCQTSHWQLFYTGTTEGAQSTSCVPCQCLASASVPSPVEMGQIYSLPAVWMMGALGHCYRAHWTPDGWHPEATQPAGSLALPHCQGGKQQSCQKLLQIVQRTQFFLKIFWHICQIAPKFRSLKVQIGNNLENVISRPCKL